MPAYAVVAVSGYDLIALLQGHLHSDHDGFLPNIEMAEAADRAHAVELAGFFLKRRISSMSRRAASSCALVNSGGDAKLFAFPFSCPDSLATLFSTVFLGAAMAIPDAREDQPSLTQLKPP